MLYTVSASGMNRERLMGMLPKTYLEIVYEHPNYIVFSSALDWDQLRKELKGFVVGILNPGCALGKEIVRDMEAKMVKDEVKGEKV